MMGQMERVLGCDQRLSVGLTGSWSIIAGVRGYITLGKSHSLGPSNPSGLFEP